jgi:hypothetical protein
MVQSPIGSAPNVFEIKKLSSALRLDASRNKYWEKPVKAIENLIPLNYYKV